MLIENLAFFALASLALILSAHWSVKSLSVITRFLRTQEFTTGFLIMAVATSTPELFVGIAAALEKNTALALGTVIGSNIIDVTLVAGIGILLSRGYLIKTKEIKKDAFFMAAFALVPLVLMFIGQQVSRLDGVILIALFSGYALRIIRRGKRHSKKYENHIGRVQIVAYTILLILSVVVMFFSADYVVYYGSGLSLDLALPPILIGLFLIAFATSLPELVFETTAILKGHSDMALGDLVGSVIANSSLVLGATALLHPISANFFLALSSGIFMFIVCFIFATFVATGNKLTWREGISLILLYVFFVILEFFIK